MSTDRGLIQDSGFGLRCWWCGSDPLYVGYHNQEWGRPVANDQHLFEKICLEGFQAGLSWLTILKKREQFREAFADFDVEQVAKFGPRQITKLVMNKGIVRHRGKIESTINNAQQARRLANEFGSLAAYFWQFEPPQQKPLHSKADVVSMSEQSVALSKDLKKRGWSFVGATTCYAFMQAMGLVNDHLQDCEQWKKVEQARRSFERPVRARRS